MAANDGLVTRVVTMKRTNSEWLSRLTGARSPRESELPGWSAKTSNTPGFVEPDLSVIEGDPSTAKLILVAAPGAVGKSSYARFLAASTNFALVDLSRTSPLGGNFFSGGLLNAFGVDEIQQVTKGELGLVVDALDEAQMRAGPQGYEAGLLDLAALTSGKDSKPTVLLGRALAVDDAYVLLTERGYQACLMQIEFFTDKQAELYLENKLPLLAARTPRVAAAFNSHGEVFSSLAQQARGKLIEVGGGERTRFAGYAPVLDAICEFTLDAEDLNPQGRITELKASSQIDLVADIILSILEREQGKLQAQFLEQYPEAISSTIDKLYTVEEQLCRVSFHLFGGLEPALPELESTQRETYNEMVSRFSPQHPFLSTEGEASNPVFAAYVAARGLNAANDAAVVRKALLAKPNQISGVFFELYLRQMGSQGRKMALADVGILYQALNSQILPGQRVQLEVDEVECVAGVWLLDVSFEILERASADGSVSQGPVWGPISSNSETELELHSPFSNVYVDAPIAVVLGDGIVQQIAAPTELSVETLLIYAKTLLVHGVTAEGQQELQTVSLRAAEASCDAVQHVTVRDASLSVSWPGAKAYPWNRYAIDVPAAAEDVTFMRRRLRRILTAFRSHSKGALVRLAKKIDHSRMTKDERGVALVDKLKEDKILKLFDAGKFYELDPDLMGKTLGIDYNSLAQSRFTPLSDSYLADVLNRVRK